MKNRFFCSGKEIEINRSGTIYQQICAVLLLGDFMKIIGFTLLMLVSLTASAECKYIWVQYPGQVGQWVYVCN